MTIMLSAFLLFSIQPLIGKLILPKLGGSTSVWTVCMLFFQTLLLLGYAFSHCSLKFLSEKKQSLLFLLFLIIGACTLPFSVEINGAYNYEDPSIPLFLALFSGIGLPFFILSASAPTLQKWFSRVKHRLKDDPYFLYSASNMGSFSALLLFPFVFERFFKNSQLISYWSWGFYLLIAFVLFCSLFISDREKRVKPNKDEKEKIEIKRKLWWIFISFLPSSMMIGVTQYITTELSPIPLLWIVPLSLYLFTFIIAFQEKPFIKIEILRNLCPMLLILLFIFHPILGNFYEKKPLLPIISCSTAFFLLSQLCHSSLAESRPKVENLTSFFLWISLGGVLGGVFNALIAPNLFSSYAEYPNILFLSGLALSPWNKFFKDVKKDLKYIGISLGITLLAILLLNYFLKSKFSIEPFVPYIIVSLYIFSKKKRGLSFSLSLFFAFIFLRLNNEYRYSKYNEHNVILQKRNFYGVKVVKDHKKNNLRKLIHGTTQHGSQHLDENLSPLPTSYYHYMGPVGSIFNLYRSLSLPRNIAVIGLGAGCLASYSSGDKMTFYEIDPEIIRIASDKQIFSYLENCGSTCKTVVGDGRIKISEAPDHSHGLILIDAFSSDSVPSHLLTLEAIEIYEKKLGNNGLIAFHISNRYLDFKPILKAHAQKLGFNAYKVPDNKSYKNTHGKVYKDLKKESDFIILTKGKSSLDKSWEEIKIKRNVKPWTDDYINLFSILKTD